MKYFFDLFNSFDSGIRNTLIIVMASLISSASAIYMARISSKSRLRTSVIEALASRKNAHALAIHEGFAKSSFEIWKKLVGLERMFERIEHLLEEELDSRELSDLGMQVSTVVGQEFLKSIENIEHEIRLESFNMSRGTNKLLIEIMGNVKANARMILEVLNKILDSMDEGVSLEHIARISYYVDEALRHLRSNMDVYWEVINNERVYS